MSKISNNGESQEKINKLNSNDISDFVIINSDGNIINKKSTISESTDTKKHL